MCSVGILSSVSVPSHNVLRRCLTLVFFLPSFLRPVAVGWSCGAMDNASDYGSEDSRFESWQDRVFSIGCTTRGDEGDVSPQS